MNGRSPEAEVRRIPATAVEDGMTVKRASFLPLSARPGQATEGRRQTPPEVLVREDRDHGHRDT